jgi:hypothetical protein
MGDLGFIDADWSLDQALIWIATRRADLVNEASDDPFVPPEQRLRWVALLLRDDMEDVPRADIEQHLLQAIKRGDVKTTVDGEPIDPRLYSPAQYVPRLDGVLFQWTDQTPSLTNFSAGGPMHQQRYQRELRPRLEISDVVRLYPNPAIEVLSGAESSSNADMTGAAGRPSSMHVVLDEFEKRIDEGRVLHSVTDEARALKDWFDGFRKGQANLPGLTAKTIRNKIGARFRSLGQITGKARN